MATVDTLERLATDKRYFIENVLLIEDKRKRLVPFKLKPIQDDMYESKTGRDIYLKPAQVGSTSIWMADFFHDCITKPGTNSVVVAHEEFITQRLLRKAHFFTDQVNKLGGFPKPHHQSSYEITWPELNSSFYIGSARAYVFGRGETIHNLLCSEYAFWPETVRIIGPALERVPLEGNLIIESTPNGEGNDFCEAYNLAKENALIEANRFTHHFYPWTMEPDYQLPPDSPYALKKDRYTPLEYTQEEKDVIRKLNATEDQIRWRRMKMAELDQLRKTDPMTKLFAQEFPEDDISCFITAGNMAYDQMVLGDKSQQCYKAPYHYEGFNVWEKPIQGLNYLVSIDPGQGIDTKTAITVWRFGWDENTEYGIHCATYAGLLEPRLTAEKAKAIAKHYNMATITLEINAHGLAVLTELKDWNRIYRRKDIVSGITTMKPGWQTNRSTKPYMIKELSKMLPYLVIKDIDIIAELRNMRTIQDLYVSIGADDIHDSVAIAIACRQSKPIRKGFVGAAGWRW